MGTGLRLDGVIVSNCCYARIDHDTGICSECKEHADALEGIDCNECGNTIPDALWNHQKRDVENLSRTYVRSEDDDWDGHFCKQSCADYFVADLRYGGAP